MSVIGSNILAGASGQGGGYNLTNSLRFRSSASASLSRTPASGSNRTTWTWSGWVKRAEISDTERVFFSAGVDGNNFTALEWINSSLFLQNYTSGTQTITSTTAVFRDPSAWYHIVLAIDTTQGTAADRAKIYVNGVQQAGFSGTPFSSSQQFWINHTYTHRIGSRQLSSADAFSEQYMTEINFVDGQALTPSSFGETSSTTGVWIPKKYTGTYGTNGFYLKFTDTTSTSTLGTDFSGNSNTWTANNISLTAGSTYDSMTDVPTLTSATTANYAVLNAAIPKTYVSTADGNLKSAGTSSTDSDTAVATIGVSSGKWYWEDRIGAISSSVYPILGAGRNILSSFIGKYPGDSSVGGFGIVVGNGNIVREGSIVTTVTPLVANDVVGFALDLDALTCAIYKNNSLIYTVTSLTAGTYYPMANEYSSSNSTHNYGQQPFTYTPPTGFIRLNTFNLPTPTIGATASTTANKYFDVSLWTSNGGTQTITGLNFQPDFWWGKTRSSAGSNYFIDAVRGTSKYLLSNSTNAEGTDANYVTAFNSDGFSMGSSQYANGTTLVAWCWDANGSGSTNTSGSITSTVSANTSAGFSIVTYTGNGTGGATIGHGLGVAPSMIILKRRNGTSNWTVGHSSLPSWAYYLVLNLSDGQGSNNVVWNSTAPTSSVFTVGTGADQNGSGNTIVGYCFAQIAGYSAMGSYTGNGSDDGTFVFTGFRPRFLMVKRTDTTSDWVVIDSARNTYNAAGTFLYPNLSNAEDVTTRIDFVSNGFKWRTTAGCNNSGSTWIYMAVAENPFKYANAR